MKSYRYFLQTRTIQLIQNNESNFILTMYLSLSYHLPILLILLLMGAEDYAQFFEFLSLLQFPHDKQSSTGTKIHTSKVKQSTQVGILYQSINPFIHLSIKVHQPTWCSSTVGLYDAPGWQTAMAGVLLFTWYAVFGCCGNKSSYKILLMNGWA